MAKALLYGAETEKEKQVRRALGNIGLKTLTLTADDLGETVGALAGKAPRTGAPSGAESVRAEVLILCGGGEGTLDRVLAALRRGGIRIEYKAVLTETNGVWTLRQLIGELAREHAALAGGFPPALHRP